MNQEFENFFVDQFKREYRSEYSDNLIFSKLNIKQTYEAGYKQAIDDAIKIVDDRIKDYANDNINLVALKKLFNIR